MGAAALHERLAELSEAMTAQDAAAIEAAAQGLQQALAALPAQAGGSLTDWQHLHAQTRTLREATLRAQAQVSQGLAALMPQAAAQALYGASGQSERARSQGLAQA